MFLPPKPGFCPAGKEIFTVASPPKIKASFRFASFRIVDENDGDVGHISAGGAGFNPEAQFFKESGRVIGSEVVLISRALGFPPISGCFHPPLRLPGRCDHRCRRSRSWQR